MPAKLRLPKGRKPTFTDAALDLFIELDRARPHDRRYTDKSKRLARALDLTTEWWQMQTVNDKSRRPCHPPECGAFHSWHKCREVRLLLLRAVEERARRAARDNDQAGADGPSAA